MERGVSRTPFYIAGTAMLMFLGYKFGLSVRPFHRQTISFHTDMLFCGTSLGRILLEQSPPATPAISGMREATTPKTPAAREAAGMDSDPHARPAAPGGDQKAKQ